MVETAQEDDTDNFVVYFEIEGQEFYLAVYLDASGTIKGVDMTSGNRVYLLATSDEMSFDELSQEIKIEISGGWDKGEIAPGQRVPSKYSTLLLEPIKEKFESLEYKLGNLLRHLMSDADGLALFQLWYVNHAARLVV